MSDEPGQPDISGFGPHLHTIEGRWAMIRQMRDSAALWYENPDDAEMHARKWMEPLGETPALPLNHNHKDKKA
jgi:hypothetical protein